MRAIDCPRSRWHGRNVASNGNTCGDLVMLCRAAVNTDGRYIAVKIPSGSGFQRRRTGTVIGNYLLTALHAIKSERIPTTPVDCGSTTPSMAAAATAASAAVPPERPSIQLEQPSNAPWHRRGAVDGHLWQRSIGPATEC
jgi:hypothetical protein